MRKIPTLFVRDPQDMRRLTREVHPDCQWVLDGEGVPTRKYDGTCVMLDDHGRWWARREVKARKAAPDNFICVHLDKTTGRRVGWEPIEQSPFLTFFHEARELDDRFGIPGTYELCGPKINGNPEGYDRHRLIQHAAAEIVKDLRMMPAPHRVGGMTYDSLREFLVGPIPYPYEGIVWHRTSGDPDTAMAKIKVRDFRATS